MFKNKKPYINFAFFVLVSFLPVVVSADTHVYSRDVGYYTKWNSKDSPYILEEGINIEKNNVLEIGEGVEIKNHINEYGEAGSLNIFGELRVKGSMEKPVLFTGIGSIYLSESVSDIDYAVFDGSSLSFVKSTTTMNHTIIKNTDMAIEAIASRVSIENSKIIDNAYGIYSNYNGPIFQVLLPYIIGHKVNAQTQDGGLIDIDQNIIKIKNSSIYGNTSKNIKNNTENNVDATSNWWGGVDGPVTNSVSGKAIVDPWLMSEPVATPVVLCCSNVIFIPGFQASRLYKDSSGLLGTSTNMLWEPNRNEDVKKLFMDKDGVSKDPAIYTKDIIDEGLGVKNIYKTFIEYMDDMVEDGSLNKWIPYPYDWRKDVRDIVDEKMVDTVTALASTSRTGKVTIIAHSNGGLLAKALVKKLEEINNSDKIDRIIYVAVPELGTPKSILGILHGYDQSILGGVILTKNIIRDFSVNLPGVYGLIPSMKFFERNASTIISDLFSSNKIMNTYDAMKSFLLNNPFSVASSSNTDIPLKLNALLLSFGESLHSYMDMWKTRNTTKTLSIVGWGMPTEKAITYEKDAHCNTPDKTKCDIEYSPEITKDGDGTVVTDSQTGNSDETVYLNLKKENFFHVLDGEKEHAEIMESSSLQHKIKDTLLNSEVEKPNYERFFSNEKPTDEGPYLTLKVHSPVDIDVYDKQGHHTGTNSKEISGSYYGDFGKIKMVYVPYDSEYQIVLSGTGAGVFSVDAKVEVKDIVIASTTFGDMPVTTLMNAEFILPTSTQDISTSYMNMDVDGDGTTDIINRSDEYLKASSTSSISDLPTYIESMKKTIIALKLPAQIEKKWLNRIDKVTKALEKKQNRKIEKIIKKLANKKIKNNRLSEPEKQAILEVFDGLLAYIEKLW